MIANEARRRGLDPNAVLSVARVEGLSGGIGDSGHAYGPFQLNNAGGVITGRHPGAYRQDVQQWANSPAGIGFALDRIAQVARGLQGRQAVEAIVRRFERPADPTGEVARASALLNSTTAPAPRAQAAPAAALGTASSPGARPGTISPALLDLLNAGNSMFGLSPVPQVSLPAPPATGSEPAVTPTNPAAGAPAPKLKRGSAIKRLEHFVSPFGVTVTSTTGGKHVKGSYHYRGRAIDVGGDAARMAAVARAALQHPADFAEMFYTGPGNTGFFIKNGQVYPNSQLSASVVDEHTNHVHLAA